MKKIVIIILLLFANFGIAQNIRATYTKTTLNMIGDESDVPSELKPSLHSFEYSDGKSIYKIASSEKSSVKLVDKETQGIKYQSVHKVILPDEDTYYKDIKNNVFRQECADPEGGYSLKDKLREFNWELTGETAVIKGYKCKKATAVVTSKYLNRSFPVYAWYCEAIPVSDGPSFYWGLPGLIIEVNMDNKYKISLTDFEIVKEAIVINEPANKNELITREELDKRW